MREVAIRTPAVLLLPLYTESGNFAAIWMKAFTTYSIFYFEGRVSGRLGNLLSKCSILKCIKKRHASESIEAMKLGAVHLRLFLQT